MHTTHLTRISAHKYIRINECRGLYWTMHTCSRSYATKQSLRPMSYMCAYSHAHVYTHIRAYIERYWYVLCAHVYHLASRFDEYTIQVSYIYLRAVCAYSRESARVKPYVYVSIYNQSYSRIYAHIRAYMQAYAHMHACIYACICASMRWRI